MKITYRLMKYNGDPRKKNIFFSHVHATFIKNHNLGHKISLNLEKNQVKNVL